VIVPPRAVRVLVHREPVDMRKSFDTLAAIVRLHMKADLLAGDVFVFVGRRRRHAKVLWWDGTGLLVLAKRLARGRFGAPWEKRGDGPLGWTFSELALFLEGSELVTRIALSPPPWDRASSPIAFG
jgi:transposase